MKVKIMNPKKKAAKKPKKHKKMVSARRWYVANYYRGKYYYLTKDKDGYVYAPSKSSKTVTLPNEALARAWASQKRWKAESGTMCVVSTRKAYTL